MWLKQGFLFGFLVSISVGAAALSMPPQVQLALEGRDFLEKHEAGYSLTTHCKKKTFRNPRVLCTNSVGQFNVALAVKREGEPFKKVLVDGRTCASKTEGFDVVCLRRRGKTNGVNTQFAVVEPQGYVVYALRRVVTSGDSYREVVYTPYVEALDTPMVREYGKAYLQLLTQEVYRELEGRKIRSLVSREAYVHERVPQEVIENLIVIEHIDHERFETEPMVGLVREVYTILGVNLGLAYNYAKSTAGARGLLQVIPSTYAGMQRKYPEAGLVSDFVHGMTDHHNAIKAAILLADHDVGIIPKTMHRSQLLEVRNRLKYQDYVASAYNGGPSRSVRLLLSGKDHVHDNPNPENRIYVAKMRALAKVALESVVGIR